MNTTFDKSPRMTIVMTSCDAYTDILTPSLQLMHKYWPDCVYSKVLTTQSDPGPSTAAGFDRVDAWGTDVPWAQRLLNTLKTLETAYFLLVLDDFFMKSPFTTAQMEHYLDIVEQNQACALRLAPLPKPTLQITQEYGEYPKGKAYRVSAQVGVWDRQYMIGLLEALQPCELWYFERFGSFLSERFAQRSLGMYKMVFPYTEVICKSRWIAGALRFCQREGVTLNRTIRVKEPTWFLLYRKVRGLVFRINPTFITKVKLRLTKGMQGR